MSITPYLFAQQVLAKSLRIFQVFFKYRWRAHRSGSRDYLVLRNHHTNTKIGKQASGFYASEKWNNLQRLVRFDRLIPFARFKALSAVCEQSESFLWGFVESSALTQSKASVPRKQAINQIYICCCGQWLHPWQMSWYIFRNLVWVLIILF